MRSLIDSLPRWFVVYLRLLYGDRVEAILTGSLEIAMRSTDALIAADSARAHLRATLHIMDELAAMLRGVGLSPVRRALLEAELACYAPMLSLMRGIAGAPPRSRDEALGDALVRVLSSYCGERGDNESAEETLHRILRERDQAMRAQKGAEP